MTDVQKKWKYATIAENIGITTTSIASVGLIAAVATTVFNPIAYAAGFGYAGYKIAKSVPFYNKKIRNYLLQKAVKKGEMTPLDSSHKFSKIVANTSKKLGMKETPPVFVIDPIALKSSLPLILRPFAKKILPESAHKIFGAVPGADMIITTQAAIDYGYPDDALEFVFAHEMSHLKTDAVSLAPKSKIIINETSKVLFWGSAVVLGAAAVASVAGLALPFAITTGGSALAAMGAVTVGSFAANVVNNLGYRAVEKRADRNALALTHDIEGAIKMMNALHGPSQKNMSRSMSKITNVTGTHPDYHTRIDNLNYDAAIVAEHFGKASLAKAKNTEAPKQIEATWSRSPKG